MVVIARAGARPSVAEPAVPAAEVLRALFVAGLPVTAEAAVEAARVVLAESALALPVEVLRHVATALPEPSRTLCLWRHACEGRDLGELELSRSGLPEDVLPVLAWCLRRSIVEYVDARDSVEEYAGALRRLDAHVAGYPSFGDAAVGARRGITDVSRLLGQLPGGWDNPGTRAGGAGLLREAMALRAELVAAGLDPDMPVAALPRRLGQGPGEQDLCRRLLAGLPGVREATGPVRSWSELLGALDAEERAPWQALMQQAGLVNHWPAVQDWRVHLRSGRALPQGVLVLGGAAEVEPVWALSEARSASPRTLRSALRSTGVQLARRRGQVESELLLSDAVVGVAAGGRSVAALVDDWRGSPEPRLRRVAERVLSVEWQHVPDPALWLSVLQDQLTGLTADLDAAVLELEGAAT